MNTPCIEWWGRRAATGYGLISEGSRDRLAHRHIYRECFGAIPDGLLVLHHCDNRPCVNPEHLYAGTHRDNTRDAIVRGRFKPPPHYTGAAHPRGTAKLSLDDYDTIQTLYQAGALQRDLAAKFGVSRSTISGVVNNRRMTRTRMRGQQHADEKAAEFKGKPLQVAGQEALL